MNELNRELILGLSPVHLSLFNSESLLHTFNFFGVGDGQANIASNYVTASKFVIPQPLYSPHGNALNPAFVELIGQAVNTFFAIFMLFQLTRLLLTKKKSHRIYTPTPFSQTLKISLVLLQVILVALLYFLNKNSYFIGGIAATVLALILHLVEFRRSPIAIESLLTYWSANTAFTFAVFIQDSYSKHKIYANSGPAYVIEIISLVNSFLIFVFEVGYYKPGFEITNEKFLDTVNLFSYFTFYYLQPSSIRFTLLMTSS